MNAAGALPALFSFERGKAYGFVLFERAYIQSESLAFGGSSTIFMSKGKRNLLGRSLVLLE